MINAAIIRIGAISDCHIEGYLAFPQRCRIVAMVDKNKEVALAKIKRYNLDAYVLEDYMELLMNKDIDLVSICTPPNLHAQIAINCLNSGKHVLIEKPMASSLKECDEIIEAAEKNKKVVSIVSQNRFKTPAMKLKKVIESGMAGKILHTQVDSFWWRGNSYYDLWWRGTWEMEGGGCTISHAVHHIDLLLWMVGMPSQVLACMSNTSHNNSEVENISISILKYEDSSVGQITTSVVHHGEEQQLILQGEYARISIPWKVYASIPKENAFPEENKDFMDKLDKLYDSISTLSKWE